MVLALPLLVLTIALFHFGLDMMHVGPEAPPLHKVPMFIPVATWLLEALALTALFLLLDGRGVSRWQTGLLTGWIAWVFRGPLLVVAAVSFAGLAARPWWGLAFSWWILYTFCGLTLAALARPA